MARESVMEVPDEEVLVLIIQRHKGPAHYNVLHLVYRMTQLFQLQGIRPISMRGEYCQNVTV